METLSPSIILTDGENCDFVKELGFDDEKIVLLEDAIRHKADDEKLKKFAVFQMKTIRFILFLPQAQQEIPRV